MYPDFRYLIHGLFGIHPPEWLSLLKTFGFMVAMGFMAATWAMISELRRKEAQGLLHPTYDEETTGKAPTAMDLFWSGLIGFLLGFKLAGIVMAYMAGAIRDISQNPMGYFFSTEGNIIGGIAGAALFAFMRYREKKKAQLPQPATKKVAVYPHQRIGEILIIAAVGGLAGAKLFNAFETWEDFIQNPIRSLTSSSGLTFYGGLIVATAVFWYFARKYKIRFAHLCDAAAPAIMIAYGIGRFGCQFAGDGDWGIYNSAYVTNTTTGKLEPATAQQYTTATKYYDAYFRDSRQVKEDGSLHNLSVMAPGWLPQSFFAQCYPHNVNNTGVALPNCTGDHCSVLPIGVFPTPLYEAFICIALFFVLWAIRKKIKVPFHFFAIYLIMNGVERFFVEKIRVNYKYDWGFIHPTQAEIISTVFVLIGISILLFYKGGKEPMALPESSTTIA
jgi:prolipoprotein diacylglyceryltransferase